MEKNDKVQSAANQQPNCMNDQTQWTGSQQPYGMNGQAQPSDGQQPYGTQPNGANGYNAYNNSPQGNAAMNGSYPTGGKQPKKKHHVVLIVVIVICILLAVSCMAQSVKSDKSGKENSAASAESSQSVEASSSEPSEQASDESSSIVENSAPAVESSQEPSKESSETSEAAQTKDEYHVGDVADANGLKITYVASGTYTEDNEFMQPKEGNKYIFLKFAFENTSKSDEFISASDFDAYADGYAVENRYLGDDDLSATLSAGRKTEGTVTFEVPENASDIEVEYEVNFITEKKIKFIYDGEKDSGFVLEKDTTATDNAYSVGDTVDLNGLKMTYVSCEPYTSDNEFIQPKDGYHFERLTLDCENDSDKDQSISVLLFACYADGVAVDQSYSFDDDLDGTVSPGHKIAGTVTFEVPDDATTVEVEYTNNVWTSDHVVFKVK